MNRKYMSIVAASLVLALSFGFAGQVAAQTAPEVITGRVIDAAGSIPGKTSAYFKIKIDKYTTDEEVMRYVLLLAEEGQDALLEAIRDLDMGYIQIGGSLGYPVSITRSIDIDGGRIVRVVTDRPIQMFEVMRGLRSREHPFGIIELKLDGEGNGEGSMIAAAQVGFNEDGVLEIESVGTNPFRLTNVKIEADEK